MRWHGLPAREDFGIMARKAMPPQAKNAQPGARPAPAIDWIIGGTCAGDENSGRTSCDLSVSPRRLSLHEARHVPIAGARAKPAASGMETIPIRSHGARRPRRVPLERIVPSGHYSRWFTSGSRTHNRRFLRPMLYPSELWCCACSRAPFRTCRWNAMGRRCPSRHAAPHAFRHRRSLPHGSQGDRWELNPHKPGPHPGALPVKLRPHRRRLDSNQQSHRLTAGRVTVTPQRCGLKRRNVSHRCLPASSSRSPPAR